MLISAFFYSGLNTGLVSKDGPVAYHPATLVDERLREFSLSADFEKQPRLVKEVANAERLRAILSGVFGEFLGQVQVLFARDWKLRTANGATTDFRMTWSAGWWLDELTSLYRRDTRPDISLGVEPSWCSL